MTPEQWHFAEEIFVGIIATNITVGIVYVWKFISAVSEVPRLKKGMRVLFEKLESIEKEIRK